MRNEPPRGQPDRPADDDDDQTIIVPDDDDQTIVDVDPGALTPSAEIEAPVDKPETPVDSDSGGWSSGPLLSTEQPVAQPASPPPASDAPTSTDLEAQIPPPPPEAPVSPPPP